MKEIKGLVAEMIEEICSAKDYAKCYQKYKEEKPNWAKKYYEMANDEIKHAMYLHDVVVEMITKQREEGGEPPQYMLDMWDEAHDEYIEKMANVKMILSI